MAQRANLRWANVVCQRWANGVANQNTPLAQRYHAIWELILLSNTLAIYPATFKIEIKMLIYKVFVCKFIYEITHYYIQCHNYSGSQQSFSSNTESAQKHKMHVELERLQLQQFWSYKIVCWMFHLTEENRQHFCHHKAYDYSKSCWYATARLWCTYHVAHLQRSPIIEYRCVQKPWWCENNQFSLVCHSLPHLPVGDRDL